MVSAPMTPSVASVCAVPQQCMVHTLLARKISDLHDVIAVVSYLHDCDCLCNTLPCECWAVDCHGKIVVW